MNKVAMIESWLGPGEDGIEDALKIGARGLAQEITNHIQKELIKREAEIAKLYKASVKNEMEAECETLQAIKNFVENLVVDANLEIKTPSLGTRREAEDLFLKDFTP